MTAVREIRCAGGQTFLKTTPSKQKGKIKTWLPSRVPKMFVGVDSVVGKNSMLGEGWGRGKG